MAERRLRIETIDDEQAKYIRRLSGAERLKVVGDLFSGVRRMYRAMLADQHPDWTDEHIEREVTRRIVSGQH